MESVQSASAQRLPYRLPSSRVSVAAAIFPPSPFLPALLVVAPTVPAAAADCVVPRDRFRCRRMAPGTAGRVGPWYDANRGPRRYGLDMNALRPPLLRRLRPGPWVAIDCAVTAAGAGRCR